MRVLGCAERAGLAACIVHTLKELAQSPQALTATPWTQLSQLFFRTNLVVWSPRPRSQSHTSPTLHMLEPVEVGTSRVHWGEMRSQRGLPRMTL